MSGVKPRLFGPAKAKTFYDLQRFSERMKEQRTFSKKEKYILEETMGFRNPCVRRHEQKRSDGISTDCKLKC